jgi:hypothetical protein
MLIRVLHDARFYGPLTVLIRKLSDQQLDSLIGKLYSVFYRIQSPRLRQEETEPREVLVQARSQIPVNNELDDDPHALKKPSAVAASISEWFSAYLKCVRCSNFFTCQNNVLLPALVIG